MERLAIHTLPEHAQLLPRHPPADKEIVQPLAPRKHHVIPEMPHRHINDPDTTLRLYAHAERECMSDLSPVQKCQVVVW